MPGTIDLFANPISGRGLGRATAVAIEQDLCRAGYAVRVHFNKPADVVVDDTAVAVVAVGGDGTLRAVVDRFDQAKVTMPPVVPVSMGTANLMSRHLGRRRPDVVGLIRRRNVKRLDAGRANGRLFLLMAGVGLDAQVVHAIDKARTGPIDILSYVLPTATTLANYFFSPITVTVDGRPVVTDQPAIAWVGNVREYGTGIPILTDADPTDGLLDLCVMCCRDQRELAEQLLYLALGEHAGRDDVSYVRGKSFSISSTTPVPVQLDGDPGGFTPVEITIEPASVPYLV